MKSHLRDIDRIDKLMMHAEDVYAPRTVTIECQFCGRASADGRGDTLAAAHADLRRRLTGWGLVDDEGDEVPACPDCASLAEAAALIRRRKSKITS